MTTSDGHSRGAWIFGSARADMGWLVVPGLAALVFSALFYSESESPAFALYAFLALGFLDSGHVYVTLWRTYFHRAEFGRRRRLYLALPFALFVFFFSWMYFRLPFLGSFIVYVTLYHNIRQFFGIGKWYQKQNALFDRRSDFFLYFLCFMPLVIAHFRSDSPWVSYYSERDVILYPSPLLYGIALGIYGLGLAAWIGFEFKRSDRNRTLAVALPALLYATSFIIGRTWVQILLPLVAAHGAAYLGLTALTLTRTRVNFSWRRAAGFVCLTALAFGALEFTWERGLPPDPSFWLAAIAAVPLVPLFCHYIFDAFLWTKDHPEAGLIFGSGHLLRGQRPFSHGPLHRN